MIFFRKVLIIPLSTSVKVFEAGVWDFVVEWVLPETEFAKFFTFSFWIFELTLFQDFSLYFNCKSSMMNYELVRGLWADYFPVSNFWTESLLAEEDNGCHQPWRFSILKVYYLLQKGGLNFTNNLLIEGVRQWNWGLSWVDQDSKSTFAKSSICLFFSSSKLRLSTTTDLMISILVLIDSL